MKGLGINKQSEHEIFNTPVNEGDKKRMQLFEKWLTSKGADLSKIEVRYTTRCNRSIHAKDDIKKDEVICRVPNECIVDEEMAYNTTIGKRILTFNETILNDKANPHFNALMAIAFFILEDKKKNDPRSNFSNYYDVLPWGSLYNFPLMYNATEHSWLAGSPTSKMAKMQRVKLGKFYEALCKECPEAKEYSFPDFLKSYLMVDSRIFVTQSKVRKFIPMFDMGNDNENPNALRVSDGDKGETMIAAKNIKKG